MAVVSVVRSSDKSDRYKTVISLLAQVLAPMVEGERADLVVKTSSCNQNSMEIQERSISDAA